MKKQAACSFRDPAGFIFEHENTLYRQINPVYRENYDHLMQSGLYTRLVAEHLLIPHREVELPDSATAYKIIKPDRINLVSYPYEWCFSQLKEAALVTLAVQEMALACGMCLKDASAYNIQFHQGRPVLIDTLSFEKYREGSPWVAYRQFCQHFLAPLALMSRRDIRLSQLLRIYIDGIPLDLASRLLPGRTWLEPALLSHIHLHARSQQYFAGENPGQQQPHRGMNRLAFRGLLDNLQTVVRRFKWHPAGTVWADYYDKTNYQAAAFTAKKQIVTRLLESVRPGAVWDLGANTGVFSRIAADMGIPVAAFDMDPAAVELSYLDCRRQESTRLLPLLLDLTNPSPAAGWQNAERLSLLQRAPVDTVLALALIHHLAIGNNLPLTRIAEFLHKICTCLIIEFIPKQDSQVRRMLATREDIFTRYTEEDFEKDFGGWFTTAEKCRITGSERTVYLMKKK